MTKIIKKRAGQSGCDDNEFARKKVVKFYCSDDEHQKIGEMAKLEGVPTVAQFARDKALADTHATTKAQRNALLKCQEQLTRIANLCADVVRVIHWDGEIDRATYGAIKDIKKIAYDILEATKAKSWNEK